MAFAPAEPSSGTLGSTSVLIGSGPPPPPLPLLPPSPFAAPGSGSVFPEELQPKETTTNEIVIPDRSAPQPFVTGRIAWQHTSSPRRSRRHRSTPSSSPRA